MLLQKSIKNRQYQLQMKVVSYIFFFSWTEWGLYLRHAMAHATLYRVLYMLRYMEKLENNNTCMMPMWSNEVNYQFTSIKFHVLLSFSDNTNPILANSFSVLSSKIRLSFLQDVHSIHPMSPLWQPWIYPTHEWDKDMCHIWNWDTPEHHPI